MTRLPAPVSLDVAQKTTVQSMEREYAAAGKHRWADRCRAILILSKGYGIEETSRITNRPYSTIQQWSRGFRRNGIRGLRPRTSTRGRKKKLGMHERKLLAKAIERGPQAAGYNSGVWTSPMVCDYILKRWNIEYHPGHVRKLLHILGFSIQFPREKLALADRNKQEQWLRKTYPRIKKKRANAKRR